MFETKHKPGTDSELVVVLPGQAPALSHLRATIAEGRHHGGKTPYVALEKIDDDGVAVGNALRTYCFEPGTDLNLVLRVPAGHQLRLFTNNCEVTVWSACTGT